MRKLWREFWYCGDGTFNRVSLIKAMIGVPLAPFAAFILGPAALASALVGLFIGDSYCSENDKEEAQLMVFFVVLIVWVFLVAIAADRGGQS